MAKLSANVPSLGAIRTSPCTSWDMPPSGGRTSRISSVSETAKTPSLIPSVRSVRYLRPVLSLSSFDEPSPLMNSSQQLPFDPADRPVPAIRWLDWGTLGPTQTRNGAHL